MASIAVFVIAFGVGCLTGAVVCLLRRDRRESDPTRAPLFVALPGDE
jgi:hypothetical protein